MLYLLLYPSTKRCFMATFKLLLRTNKKKANGEIPIYLRITENRKSRFLSTGISVKPKYWIQRSQRVSKSHPQHAVCNNELERLLHEAQATALDLKADRKAILSAQAVKRGLKNESPRDFFMFADGYVEQLDLQNKFWEWKKTRVLLAKLRTFTKGQGLSFDEIDREFLLRFEKYMRDDLENKTNTIAKNLQIFHRIIKRAIRDDLLPPSEDPFLYHTVRTEKTKKDKLSIQDIQNLEGLDLSPGTALWHTRNYFMFSFYCAGVRFGDLCRLTWKNIVDGRLEYRMAKTGTPKSIKLVGQAQAILALYRDTISRPEQFIFPLLNSRKDYSDPRVVRRAISSRNTIVNKNLKKLAEMADVEANVSFHIARHSFADFARKRGQDLYVISKALGHANLKVTETYLKSFDHETVDQAMDDLFDGM